MKIRGYALFTVFIAFSIMGCASMQKDIAANKEKVSLIEKEKEALNERVNALEANVNNLSVQVADIENLKNTVEGLKSEDRLIEGRVSDIEAKMETAGKVNAKVTEAGKRSDLGRISGLKVKVLSGNGKLSPARATAKKLESEGYKVGRIDIADRHNFSRAKVFYAAGYQQDASGVAQTLGTNPEILPMSWNSIFNIIIVVIGK